MAPRELTELGRMLEQARNDLGLSLREVGRRSGMSEGRWRQIVAGTQPSGGRTIPVNVGPRTIASMALAVSADVRQALLLGGFERSPEQADLLVSDIHAGKRPPAARNFDLDFELERAAYLDVPQSTKAKLVTILAEVHEALQAAAAKAAAAETAESDEARSREPISDSTRLST